MAVIHRFATNCRRRAGRRDALLTADSAPAPSAHCDRAHDDEEESAAWGLGATNRVITSPVGGELHGFSRVLLIIR
jgi:hypothetical protein